MILIVGEGFFLHAKVNYTILMHYTLNRIYLQMQNQLNRLQGETSIAQIGNPYIEN